MSDINMSRASSRASGGTTVKEHQEVSILITFNLTDRSSVPNK